MGKNILLMLLVLGISGNAYSQGWFTVKYMKKLGKDAAAGDKTAIDKLVSIREKLYKDLDYLKDQAKLYNNLKLIKAAMNEIAVKAGTDQKAFDILMYASTKKNLKNYTVDAFGTAATLGNEKALDVLLNYKKHGFSLSSTVYAMYKPAEKLNPKAVNFLIKVLSNDQDRRAWYKASEGLDAAARAGNKDAIKALEKYKKSKKK